MCGTAAALSSRSTVMRTISEPARCSAATCATVPSMSAVSVLVIDCTTTGAPPPTITPPTSTPTEARRGRGVDRYPVIAGLLANADQVAERLPLVKAEGWERAVSRTGHGSSERADKDTIA